MLRCDGLNDSFFQSTSSVKSFARNHDDSTILKVLNNSWSIHEGRNFNLIDSRCDGDAIRCHELLKIGDSKVAHSNVSYLAIDIELLKNLVCFHEMTGDRPVDVHEVDIITAQATKAILNARSHRCHPFLLCVIPNFGAYEKLFPGQPA